MKETGLNKCARSRLCNVFGSKACREKMRRDRLNDKEHLWGWTSLAYFKRFVFKQRISVYLIL
ncbi:hypothetical protein RchiOBHm_Chr4g0387861 [Rosa chinensis]|uniref:Uncharacterized protein n=1 Tax=Rosa chinensis TaxID=74649 RepID=A0A2P6QPM8_ROSCH|nr:hypothetical protein RchiOBHm_Chr4g0387861 [Rosa chinensis]